MAASWRTASWMASSWMTASWMAASWMAASWMAASNLKSLQKPLRRNWILGQPLLVVSWLLKHPAFWFTLTQSVRPPMVTYPSLCTAYMTYGTSCHSIGHEVLSTQPLPREADDFPRGGNHSKHVPLLTCLAWLQPIYSDPKFIFMHVKTKEVLLVAKTLIKNIEQQPL